MSAAQQVYETTTRAIVEAIEAGANGWQMPWSTDGIGFPHNPTTDKHYRGGNVLALWATALGHRWEHGQWATYKQWASIGAQVRRGEHGTRCLYWDTRQKRLTITDEATSEDVELTSASRLTARAFTVFNTAQVDGYEPPPVTRNTDEQIATSDAFFTSIGAHVEHNHEGRAYYQPGADRIVLPPFTAFSDAHAYYATSAHEHAHWTGHPSRLDRHLGQRFGDDAYAAEELCAELSAAYTCGLLGISTTPRTDHAAYLAHWLRILDADPRHLFTIASGAQAATDHLTTLAAQR